NLRVGVILGTLLIGSIIHGFNLLGFDSRTMIQVTDETGLIAKQIETYRIVGGR
ncbi:hypothetical protein MKW92_025449, partial [Papaver armeniacum]